MALAWIIGTYAIVSGALLIALGFRSLSMAPASIGPVKTMILALNAGRAAKVVDDLLKKGTTDIRGRLDSLAKSDGIEA